MAEKLINTNSPTWIAIRKHVEDRLATLRANLEGDLPRKPTHKARGGIIELKSILALVKEEEILTDPPEELPG